MEDLTAISDQELRSRLMEKEELVDLALHVGGIGMRDWRLDPNSDTPEDRAAVRDAVSASIGADAPYDYSFHLTNGKYIRGKGRVFRDADGRAVRMVGVCVEDKIQTLKP